MKYRAIFGLVALALVASFGTYTLYLHPKPVVADNIDSDTDENISNPEAYASAVSLAVSAPKVKYQVSSSTPQFVLLSFDGSKSINMLNETLGFEQQMQAEGKPLHFTYFINAAYFLTKDTAQLYQPPRGARGTSPIGFSSTTLDIAQRVKTFNTAFAQGNEIGSHSAGHYNGTTWTYDEWRQEFASFGSLMSAIQQNNPSQQIDMPTFLAGIQGFRAPYLGVDDALYKTLEDFHFTYDTSGIGSMDVWPRKDAYGVWHIPLGTIFIGVHRRPVVAMDYNLFKLQSNAKETAIQGTGLWNTYFDQVFSAYTDYFNTNYQGNRAPIVIGEHFSKWNDGVYWEALKIFAESVCGRPWVRCVTYKEVVEYLNQNGPPPLVQ
jgi:hypothetical protein